MSTPARPLPLVTPLNEFFWTAGADGRLRFQQCLDCRGLFHPAKPVCPYCRSTNLGITEVSGRATLAGAVRWARQRRQEALADRLLVGEDYAGMRPGAGETDGILVTSRA